MKKKLIAGLIVGFIVIFTVVVFVLGNLHNTTTIDFGAFQNENGQYEYETLPLGSTISEIEKSLNVKLDEPDFTMETVTSYSLDGVYDYNEFPLQTRLEFNDGTLETVFFSMEANAATTERQFSELSKLFTVAYGEPTQLIDKSSEGTNALLGNVSSQGSMWLATDDDAETGLQLMMMTGDKMTPNLSIAVGIVPQ